MWITDRRSIGIPCYRIGAVEDLNLEPSFRRLALKRGLIIWVTMRRPIVLAPILPDAQLNGYFRPSSDHFTGTGYDDW